MKRRSFLAALFAAPALPAVAKINEDPQTLNLSGLGEDLYPSHVAGTIISMEACNANRTRIVVNASQFDFDNGRVVINADGITVLEWERG